MFIVTGSAGFIGFHVSQRLLEAGEKVVSIDEINNFYSQSQKESNLNLLLKHPNFSFYKKTIENYDDMDHIFHLHHPLYVIHLAARAGVRQSILDPNPYIESNIRGTTVLLQLAAKYNVRKFIYASSSSVYGTNLPPFNENQSTDHQTSPYAVSKKTCEIMAHTYSLLYGLETVGLRFFTVYGPRGRPDMAPFIFTKGILTQTSIKKYGDGSSARDYTYIDDIVDGILACIHKDTKLGCKTAVPASLFNLGNNRPVKLNALIKIIEETTGKTAIVEENTRQLGDVEITWADLELSKKVLGYEPKISLEEGIKKLVEWMKSVQ